ncbi:hypothetical protein [Legionella drozanskii]|uniref:Uncharacterized protein n=1 Tax=Legionella drozanskii LLAP-1 TaxID=1212489 RepID=A0A0W0SS79_9GAMM|nr:hypothetical protein [Legionella drozanskii]KTC85829.1 hypothetical protein Ldro_2154 [Legionella drozanskii LLAP-1]
MLFKDWCLSQYGIINFLEAKILNRVFIPLIYRTIDPQFVADNNGYLIRLNDVLGLVISKENYDNLIFHIYSEYQQYCPEINDEKDFERFREIFLFRLGLDAKKAIKYKQPSNIQVTFCEESLRAVFTNHFARYNPKLKLDPLTNNDVVEMPPHFLNDLYESYYQGPFAEIKRTTDLAKLKEQETTLKKLLHEVSRNKFILDGINKLSLDYDNFVDLLLSNREACEAYALSLRVFAEVNRDNLSSAEYQVLLITSTFLVARDKRGVFRQSLITELEFSAYIRNQLYGQAIEEMLDIEDNNPLLHELPTPYDKQLPELIQNNIRDLLEGNPRAVLNKNSSYVSLRFLSDQKNYFETDEILIRGGAHRNHFALFSIIKVGVLENGQSAGLDDIPHHHDYYKVEFNLGSKCPGVDIETKTGWGTFVTKLTPFTYDSDGSLIPLNVNPYTQPEHYKAAMEQITIPELIRVEREIIFYRPEGRNNDDSKSTPNPKEADEWVRLFKLRQLLSGFFYLLPVKYYIRDPIDPRISYERVVHNQRGFIQEDGSCPAFTLKSWLDSMLGHELNSLFNHYVQQHNTNEQAIAVRASLSRVQGRIRELEPLEIKGSNREVQTWFKAFKKYLGEGVQMSGVKLEKVGRGPSSSYVIKISNSRFKILWDNFFEGYDSKQYSNKRNTHLFFPRDLQPGEVRIVKRSEHPDTVVENLTMRQH